MIKETFIKKLKSGKLKKAVRKTKKIGYGLFSGRGTRELVFTESCGWETNLLTTN